MCGIYGLLVNDTSKLVSSKVKQVTLELAHTAGYRGYDSSGCMFVAEQNKHFKVLKADVAVSQLTKSKEFDTLLREALTGFASGIPFQMMGHARLATNGSQNNSNNNQPVSLHNCTVIHNGIITNLAKLWQEQEHSSPQSQLDTEIITVLLNKHLQSGADYGTAIQQLYKKIEGSASIALRFHESDSLYLATNTGSLFYLVDEGVFLFASERYFIERAKRIIGSTAQTMQLLPGTFLHTNAATTNVKVSSFSSSQSEPVSPQTYTVSETILARSTFADVVLDPSAFIASSKTLHLERMLEINNSAIAKLKRCTCCILPETFPFIVFDAEGVCNYCKNYVPKLKNKNTNELEALLRKYSNDNKSPKCIVPFSGGRDSSYSVHVLVKEFGLKPITYTYDWGMVTDLARRNIARVTGKLGLENIIVSADINQKRRYIRQNILAWLKRPALGMIPLFMSGDKSFHLYLHKIKQHTGISLNIWGENFLEKTDFKVGFAGVAPEFEKEKIYSLKTGNMFKMLGYIGNEVLHNPSYLNASVIDNFKAQYSRFLLPKTDYYNFFDFYPWEEQRVDSVLKNEYDWEKSPDAESTWRIGDGTSAFYNYIYLRVAGFSEFDTFRSNQVREGMMDRSTALSLANRDNAVRFATLRWYLQILELDFETVISKINKIPTLYPQ